MVFCVNHDLAMPPCRSRVDTVFVEVSVLYVVKICMGSLRNHRRVRPRKSPCKLLHLTLPMPLPLPLPHGEWGNEAQGDNPMQFRYIVDVAMTNAPQGNTLYNWIVCEFEAIYRKHILLVHGNKAQLFKQQTHFHQLYIKKDDCW